VSPRQIYQSLYVQSRFQGMADPESACSVNAMANSWKDFDPDRFIADYMQENADLIGRRAKMLCWRLCGESRSSARVRGGRQSAPNSRKP
jgi:hypothetical protein